MAADQARGRVAKMVSHFDGVRSPASVSTETRPARRGLEARCRRGAGRLGRSRLPRLRGSAMGEPWSDNDRNSSLRWGRCSAI
jgi:hypothetical protein